MSDYIIIAVLALLVSLSFVVNGLVGLTQHDRDLPSKVKQKVTVKPNSIIRKILRHKDFKYGNGRPLTYLRTIPFLINILLILVNIVVIIIHFIIPQNGLDYVIYIVDVAFFGVSFLYEIVLVVLGMFG